MSAFPWLSVLAGLPLVGALAVIAAKQFTGVRAPSATGSAQTAVSA